MTYVTKNFTREELACKHCGRMHIPQSSLDRLQRVRDRFGKRMTVSSGDRCPDHNAAVSKTGRDGPHTKGAFDILVSGADAYALLRIALEEGFTGIGVSQKGDHGARFLHMDDLPDAPGQPRPTVWSYP